MATPETAKKGLPQVEFGAIMTDGRWRFSTAADPSTVAAQVEKLRRRFRLSRVVLVGGMLTDARKDLKPGGLDQRSACARDPGLGCKRHPAILPFRRARHRGGHGTLPRGAPRGLPKSFAGEGAGAQAQSSVAGCGNRGGGCGDKTVEEPRAKRTSTNAPTGRLPR